MWQIETSKLIRQFIYNPAEPLIFSTALFLFLFTGFMLVYFILHRHHRAKASFVTLFSLFFYYKSSGIYFVLLIISAVVDYLLASAIYSTRSRAGQRGILTLSLMLNLGLLAYFKYTNFFFEIYSDLTDRNFTPLDIILPVGVSFFTFQSLSYTIDIYRGTLKPVKNILDYAFFVTFFPQLVAGPIVRAASFIPQIFKPVTVTREMLGRAVFLIGGGLIKKAVIADYISINFVDRVFENPSLYTGLENLMAVYGYALQIYCDFSGYSDMAIGIALLMGFHFPINFNSPYKSLNITDFWRRWHISLSTWLRDYLYFSLGGNRKGRFRTYLNLFITMLLGGLWHGAGFRFILWGGLHGLALALHKLWMQVFPGGTGKPGGFSRFLLKAGGFLLTFHFVCFCWIFFRAETMDAAFVMIDQIVHNFRMDVYGQYMSGYRTVLIVMTAGYILHFLPVKMEQQLEGWVTRFPLVLKAVYLVVVIMIVVQFKSAGIQPFIYFQF